MRKTAGIQINIDFKNKKDAYLKSKFLNLITPFMCGLCANSPIENNILSKNKTNRAYAWLYTGKNRCNFFYQNVYKKKFKKFENFFKNYIEEIISIPMVFLERNNELIPINGKINFKEFINENYLNHQAEIEDYLLHQSLVFPDIRIKNYIEIRNHDSSNSNIALALCAFYKGLFKEDIENLLKKFDYLKIENIEKYNKEVIKNGLNFKINKNLDAWQVVEKLFKISKNNLSNKEKDFIKPLVNLIENKKTQADILIEQNITNAEELVSFLYE